jgi:two-component system chemotaxis sensor kinase CheA
MKKNPAGIIFSIFIGNRYSKLEKINDQAKYLILNFVFIVALIPLTFLGYVLIYVDRTRSIVDFSLAFLLLTSIVLLRTKLPFKAVPFILVPLFGAYTLYLLRQGTLEFWTAAWIFIFPLVAIILCHMIAGLIQSLLVLAGAIVIMYVPGMGAYMIKDIRVRFIIVYSLILSLAVIYELISMIKDKKEKALNAELAKERDVIQTMQNNIPQGIFLMDSELKILPGYSKPLLAIFSSYDSNLDGKNFLDLLQTSLDVKQLQTMKGYFSMIFEKSKNAKVLETANPISEFEYRVDDGTKTLSTNFQLIERSEDLPVIIGIIQDISKEKEFEMEMQARREVQEMEMKNMFDVLQVDPLVFNDFIEDTDTNFNYINTILKDRSLTEKQVLTKFFQTVHAIKSNALILGLETFGKKLHALEDDIKAISAYDKIQVDDVLGLAIKLESILKEKDEYIKITKKIEAFKTSNQIDTVLFQSLSKAVQKVAEETKKKVELKVGQVDISILETKLRKPIKDILFQCVRNSIYHGIEPLDERIQKNKKPVSLLVFSIQNVDGKAEVIFSDDGRGLDWEKIKKRYIELNPEAKDTSKKALLVAIFSPEFSTSEEITTVAGRGVGLSLVKDLVKENHGIIKADSSESGLTLKFIFPIPDAE